MDLGLCPPRTPPSLSSVGGVNGEVLGDGEG